MDQMDRTANLGTNHKWDAEPALMFSMELSSAKWKLAFHDGRRDRARLATIDAGDYDALTKQVERARKAMGVSTEAKIWSCYEAGREGFSVHRRLEQLGVNNVVIDAASVEVSRRARRAKTDRLDAEMLVTKLLGHRRGEKAFAVLRVPTPQDEGQRHEQRQLDDLKVERGRHRQRIHAWLLTEGICMQWSPNLVGGLKDLRSSDGRNLSPVLVQRIQDEDARLALVNVQIARIEEARKLRLKAKAKEKKERKENNQKLATEHADDDAMTAASVGLVQQLTGLRGIGPTSAFRLVLECFAWRKFKNRREVGSFFGLAPSPYASGNMKREQGIAKLGRGALRSLLIELSWLWLQYQPQSKIAVWFKERFANGGTRMRRIGITAVARRLAIALWQFIEFGAVPEGAVMKT